MSLKSMEPQLEDPPLKQLDKIQEYRTVILYVLLIVHIVLKLCFLLQTQKVDQICRKSAVVLRQMFIILTVFIAAVNNPTKTKDNNEEIWISLLCSMIRNILPNPKMRRTDNTQAGVGKQ